MEGLLIFVTQKTSDTTPINSVHVNYYHILGTEGGSHAHLPFISLWLANPGKWWVTCSSTFIFKRGIFIENRWHRKSEGGGGLILCPFIHSANGGYCWSWAGLKPGAKSLLQVSYVNAGAQGSEPFSCVFPDQQQGAGTTRKQPGT